MLAQLRRSDMFETWSGRPAKYSAPTELMKYLVGRGYKHSVPYGTALRKNLAQKTKS